MSSKRLIFLRAETKGHERRTPLTPENAKKLIETGLFEVQVQRWADRIFPDEEYAQAGCTLVDTDYKDVPASASTFIMGLKALPKADTSSLAQQHIYFAHAFKNQFGWQDTIQRFAQSGTIYDIEFLVDERGRRVAAFGKPAGIAGCALGLMAWAYKKIGNKQLADLKSFDRSDDLFQVVAESISEAHRAGAAWPKVIILGAKGRVGSGALETIVEVEKKLKQISPDASLGRTLWDLEETAKGGPFSEILEHDVFVNCILLTTKIPPFITNELLQSPTKNLSIVVDVSCDYDNPNNPLPIYNQATSWETPCIEVAGGVQVISIDNLPSLIPRESSIAFSADLYPHLLTLPDGDVWKRAKKVFDEKVAELQKQQSQ